METIVRDLMTAPPVTCPSGDPLARAARIMADAEIGSVVVTDQGKVVGILTERDLLRAAAAGAAPENEDVGLWMTAHPDVLRPDEKADAAWASLTAHHYRHLPVVEGTAGRCGLAARPHGPGPDPTRCGEQDRRAGRVRRRRGGGNDGG